MKTNNAEGGSNGTLVTTGNSGGVSGDAFTSRGGGVNSSFKFSSAAAIHGALGYEFENDTGVADTNYVSWDDTALTDYWGSVSIKLPAAPTATTEFRQFRTAAAGQIAGHIALLSTRQLQLRTSAEAIVSTMATALTVGTPYRLTYRVQSSGASSVLMSVFLYTLDTTTLLDSLVGVSVTSSGAIPSIGSTRMGPMTNTTNTNSVYMDDLVEFSTTEPAPAASLVVPTRTLLGVGV